MSCETIAIILAAGKGERLGLKGIPKPMAEVAGKPVLGHDLLLLHQMSLTRESIVVVIGAHKEVIESYCGKDVTIKTQENLNGNLGALEAGLRGLDLDSIKNVLVLQADDCLTLRPEVLAEMLRFHEHRKADVTLLLTRHFDPSAHRRHYIIGHDKTIVSVERVDQLSGEGNFLAGVFCFSKKFLQDYLQEALMRTDDTSEKTIPTLLKVALTNQSRVYGFSFEGTWVSINTPGQLERARNEILR